MHTLAKGTLALASLAAFFLGGSWYRGRTALPASAETGRRILYYACPMHPQYKSDRPGDAPCCGMRLEPVYSGGTGNAPGPATPDLSGAVQINAATQQLIGVRTDEVRRASVSHLLRVPGRIAVDESRLYRLNAAVDGWIREIGGNPAGTYVKQNQILASYYTPGFLGTQQSFFFALRANEQSKRGELNSGQLRTPGTLNLQTAVDSLRSLGMNNLQIEELRQAREPVSLIHIYSPITGFVLLRNISPQQGFDKGAELYRIADISHVWVAAAKPTIGSSDGDCAPSPSHTTVCAVLRMRRLNPAAVTALRDPMA